MNANNEIIMDQSKIMVIIISSLIAENHYLIEIIKVINKGFKTEIAYGIQYELFVFLSIKYICADNYHIALLFSLEDPAKIMKISVLF